MATEAETADDTRRYRIVRFYADPLKRRRRIRGGLTLAEAQRHCSDPESSSTTCALYENRLVTMRNGAWFDGYEEELNHLRAPWMRTIIRQNRKQSGRYVGPGGRQPKAEARS